jgi:hypothetical protein
LSKSTPAARPVKGFDTLNEGAAGANERVDGGRGVGQPEGLVEALGGAVGAPRNNQDAVSGVCPIT